MPSAEGLGADSSVRSPAHVGGQFARRFMLLWSNDLYLLWAAHLMIGCRAVHVTFRNWKRELLKHAPGANLPVISGANRRERKTMQTAELKTATVVLERAVRDRVFPGAAYSVVRSGASHAGAVG